MSAALLRVEGLSKAYPLTIRSGDRLRALWQILRAGRAGQGTEVLARLDFEVRAGESLAVIGANGAGKSTLLKLITGVLAPTTGRIEAMGRQAALLELGAGFEPEYSGLDNLRMNGTLLGLTSEEIDDRLDDILAFADIGSAIHEPVKHYSSGMVVRLGFAVIASVRPDLLITDEVLAVGDESFQKKCIRWIERYLGEGGTLLMVSHNMYQVQKLCRQALWLDEGRAREYGDVFGVTQAYLAWHERRDARQVHAAAASPHLPSIQAMEIVSPAAAPAVLGQLDDLQVRASIRCPEDRPPVVQFGIVRADGTPVFGISSEEDGVVPLAKASNLWEASVRFPAVGLMPGDYFVRVCALDPEGLRACDNRDMEFSVRYPTRQQGLVRLPYEWLGVAAAAEAGQSADDQAPAP